ncbi:MAG: hypothetical protein F4Y14_11415, partial [Acidobacteria bacterium]|nr:hypothetical protein [Acidobacteriota bacterium]
MGRRKGPHGVTLGSPFCAPTTQRRCEPQPRNGLKRLLSAVRWAAVALSIQLLPAGFASGQQSIPKAELRWNTAAFQNAAERQVTGTEGQTVYLSLELTNVTQAWLNDRKGRSVGARLTRLYGNAIASDYSHDYTVWIPADKLAVSFGITLNDDSLIEGTELTSVCFAPTGDLAISHNTHTRCAEVVIRDNDVAVVSVTGGRSRRTVDEGEAVALELTLNKDVERNVHLSLSVSDGSTSSDDYTLSPQQINFSPTDTDATRKRTVTLMTTGDNVVEGDEDLTIQWALRSGGVHDAISLEGNSVPVTITDDDSAVLTLESSPEPVSEGSNVTLTARLSNPVQEAFGLDWWVSATSGSVAGFASYSDLVGLDLTSTNILNFASRQTAATFTVRTADDTVAEDSETFKVLMQLQRTVHGLDPGTVRTDGRTVTITDDDQATVSLTPAAVTVTEGSAATLKAQLAQAAETEVKASWSTAGGTATAGTDYTAQAATTLTFARGETQKTLTVATTGDEDAEEDETFNVKLATVEGGRATIGTGTVPVTIQDRAPERKVSVSAPATVTEGSAASFTVSLSLAATSNVIVGYHTVEGTAGASDFTPVAPNAWSITFAPGETRKTISVQTTDDDVFENDETFSIRISLLTTGYELATSEATATIRDNETATLSLSGPSGLVNEGDSAEFTWSLSRAVTSAVDFQWVVVPWRDHPRASHTTDVTYVRARTTFAPGETTKTITVQTTQDTIVEANEHIGVSSLLFLSLPDRVTLGTTYTYATIRDDDSLTASVADLSVSESAGSASLTVTLSSTPERDVTLSYASSDGTATAGSDYTATSGTLTIPSGRSTGVVRVRVTDDAVDEPDETLTVTLSDPKPSAQVSLSDASATVTITDNEDAPTLSLELSSSAIPENGGSATVTAALNLASSEDVTVTVSAAPVSPAVAADFTLSTNKTLTIAAGSTTSTGTVTLTAVDNDIVAAAKRLTVSGSASGGRDVADPSSTTLRILEDESAVLAFGTASVSVTEGTAAVVTVSLSSGLAKATTVLWTTAHGTADRSDYTPRTGARGGGEQLTFAAGEKEKTITVQTTADNLVEADETFTIRLFPTYEPLIAAVGTGSVTATIVNDDNATVSVADAAVSESAGTATLTVTLSAAAARPLELSYETSDGTASSGSDYTAASGSLTVPAGQTSQDLTLTVLDDEIDEPDETFDLTVSAATSTPVTLDDSAATVTITDDEDTPTVSLALSSSSVTENGGSTTVTATLSAASSEEVTVTVAAAAVAPAVAGDFTQAGTTLTIAAGSTTSTGTVTITAVDNDVDAPDKQVTVSATVAGGNDVAAPSDQTLTITDDEDTPTVSLALSASSIS